MLSERRPSDQINALRRLPLGVELECAESRADRAKYVVGLIVGSVAVIIAVAVLMSVVDAWGR